MAKKIAIITSHPIQYNSPLFALMTKEPEIDLMVFYTWGEASLGPKYDPDFRKEIDWDIPLLEGYKYTFLQNTSKEPGSNHFKGIINPTLNKEIETWGADFVWVWGWAFESHLKAILYFKGKVPVWFRGDSTLLDESKGISLKKMARRFFLTWVYSHIDKSFYVGTHNKAYFRAHGMKETQLVYAPHAIDNDRFTDCSGDFTNEAMIWKKELGIKNDQKVLLFVGKFEIKKNPLYFKELIACLEGQGYVGIMVGNGILENDLFKNSTANLIFLPFQNQTKMPVVYRLADALILPSVGPGETWGLVINEALACGTNVFASKKCGGSIDLLSKNQILTLTVEKDVQKIQSFIKRNDYKTILSHNYSSIVTSVVNNL